MHWGRGPWPSRPPGYALEKVSLPGGPGTQGSPGFRIVRFRMQNSSAQTTACGRKDAFLILGRNSNICGRYDLFRSSLDFGPKIRTSVNAMIFFCSSLDFWAPPKGNRPLAQLLSARYRCGRSGVRFPGRSNRHTVANDSPPLRRFFGAVLPRR